MEFKMKSKYELMPLLLIQRSFILYQVGFPRGLDGQLGPFGTPREIRSIMSQWKKFTSHDEFSTTLNTMEAFDTTSIWTCIS